MFFVCWMSRIAVLPYSSTSSLSQVLTLYIPSTAAAFGALQALEVACIFGALPQSAPEGKLRAAVVFIAKTSISVALLQLAVL